MAQPVLPRRCWFAEWAGAGVTTRAVFCRRPAQLALLLLTTVGLLLLSVCTPGGGGGVSPRAKLTARLPEEAPGLRPQSTAAARPRAANEDVCPAPGRLLSVNRAGRLGNIMCEYATLLGASHALRRPAWLLPEMAETLTEYFEPPSTPVLPRHCRLNWTNITVQRLMAERPTGDQNHLISRWPHAVPLFHPLRQRLLREFTFRPELRARAAGRLAELARRANLSEPTFIGVHVRRTDYDAWLVHHVRGRLVGVDYLDRAMALMRRRHARVLFVVVSDDMAWCRRELRVPDVFLAGDGVEGQPGADLALLAACNHTVVTHGTFGFWAAYLAGGAVVAPSGYGQTQAGVEKDVRRAGLDWIWLEAFDPSGQAPGT